MKVILVKRGRVVHCGHKVRHGLEILTISLCNSRWDADDKTSVGETSEVTCKRCLKIMERVDENGCVTVGKKK